MTWERVLASKTWRVGGENDVPSAKCTVTSCISSALFSTTIMMRR